MEFKCMHNICMHSAGYLPNCAGVHAPELAVQMHAFQTQKSPVSPPKTQIQCEIKYKYDTKAMQIQFKSKRGRNKSPKKKYIP